MINRRTPLYALYVADTISLAGNSVAQIAIPWYVLTTTGSATLTALVVFFNFLPIVLAAFFGGVVVDRLGFRAASIVADLASSVAVAAIPLLHATVGIEIWQLMVLVFVGALLDAPGATARAALFPDVVELADVRMERASGVRAGIQRGAELIGAPLGGVLVAGFGATAALWIDGASFLVSAALVLLFVPRAHRDASADARGRFFSELADGLRFIWQRPLVRAVVAMVLLSNFIEAPGSVVLAVFAREEYGSAADFGLLVGVLGTVAVPLAARARLRRRLHEAPDDAHRVEVEWQAMVERIGDLGVIAPRGSTPRQAGHFFQREAYLEGAESASLRRVVDTVERSRYAPPGTTLVDIREDAHRVVRAVSGVRRRRDRLRALLWPQDGLVEWRDRRAAASRRARRPWEALRARVGRD